MEGVTRNSWGLSRHRWAGWGSESSLRLRLAGWGAGEGALARRDLGCRASEHAGHLDSRASVTWPGSAPRGLLAKAVPAFGCHTGRETSLA